MTVLAGWLLDVATERAGITLWVKEASGKVHRLLAPWAPALYAVPAGRGGCLAGDPPSAIRSLESLDAAGAVDVVHRRVRLDDVHDTPVLRVRARDPPSFKPLVSCLQAAGRFELFNIDIPAFQAYLYETGLFPLARASFTVRGTGTVITRVERADDKTRPVYHLPPLRAAWVDVVPRARDVADRHRLDTPIQAVTVQAASGEFSPWSLERGPGIDEECLLRSLAAAVRDIDPDVVLTRGGDERVFPHACSRASALGIGHALSLSRTGRPLASECFRAGNDGGDGAYMSYGRVMHRSPTQYYLSGRLHVDTSIHGSLHFHDGNLPGLIEVARVSSVPLQRLNRITIGGALQSIQFQIAHDRGILIPHVKRSAESFKSAGTLLLSDRGGHILEPRTGVFDHVVALDFTSMYPMIMDRFNVSPETINCACCDPASNPIPGLPGFHVCTARRGLVPDAIGLPLRKRVAYKHMARRLGSMGTRFDQMQSALKWILVVSFGYLGFKNARFGRVEAHQAVCAYSREVLLEAAATVRARGFEVIHGIVDSLWIRSNDPGAWRDDKDTITAVCDEIEQRTSLPIESDGTFKFIVFLPSVVNPAVATLNRYWGALADGSVKVRGIELRRHDTPPIVKAMQRDAIQAMAAARDAREFRAMVPRARAVLARYLARVRSGDVDPAELVVRSRMSKDPTAYKGNVAHVIAAKQLQRCGVKIGAGQDVSYIITNASSPRAADRVIAWDLHAASTARPDLDRYAVLLSRAFSSLFPFPVDGPGPARGGRSRAASLDRWT